MTQNYKREYASPKTEAMTAHVEKGYQVTGGINTPTGMKVPPEYRHTVTASHACFP